ncbi:MAG: gamma-glutamyltranspeptidase / glutathione hydrolase [Sphingomonadales bacterium]|nr:gamma-glutamyltranspeptidase / glutathione hydrolase [Sphingomonadales bacterium]
MRLPSLALIAGLLASAGPATTAAKPVTRAASTAFAPGMVSAADPRAAEAGAEMLRKGGSAVDAAFATLLALNVVEPESQGIGGGSYLVYSARGGTPVTFDGRETAPRAATGTWFYKDGQPLDHEDAVPGGKSVGVPGNLRMMGQAHQRYGKLPWAALFQPAIKLARDGFRITPRLYGALDGSRRTGALSAEGRSLFYQADGNPKPVGTLVKNPAFAAFLEGIAVRGAESFYAGSNARNIVATVNGSPINPSQMTGGDIASYKVIPRAPVCGTYRGYRICGMGPSSSGGTTVFETLKQLERFNLSALGPNSPVAWHLIAESMRLAYADREQYLGDPGYVSVPVAGLMDPAYLAKRSALISADRTMASVAAGHPTGAPKMTCTATPVQERGTSHFVAVDAQGNVASETSTIEDIFGSGLMVSGYYLNNELTDFNIVPDKNGCLTANRVEGGKRPRSSMSPTIVWDPNGHVRLAVGAAGGATIPAQVLKAIIGVVDWHLSAQQAIALPVLFAPTGDTVYVERGTYLETMIPQLQTLGHNVKAIPPGFKANAIEWVNGRWVGAADPRSEGTAVSQ